MKIKIVLASSANIAIDTFKTLIDNFDVQAIITQPDRKKGRGLKLSETPIALLGKQFNINVFKPEKISTIYNDLQKLDFDFLLTFAYGQFIPSNILLLAKKKSLNIHGSLLPKYRGAAPIQYAILNNESEIGISLIEMTKQMDAGDIYFKASQKINSNTTSGDGFAIISKLANENIISWITKIFKNDYETIFQDNNNVTFSPKIPKSMCEITNNNTIYEIQRKIKAFNPMPGAFIYINDKRIKLFNYCENAMNNTLEIKCKDGKIFINEYQYEGKKRIII